MKIDERSDKGTQLSQDVTTAGLYWELLTKQPAPHYKYLVGWLKIAPIDEVLSQIESVQHIARKGNAHSAGRMISANLRNRREQMQGVGVLHFN